MSTVNGTRFNVTCVLCFDFVTSCQHDLRNHILQHSIVTETQGVAGSQQSRERLQQLEAEFLLHTSISMSKSPSTAQACISTSPVFQTVRASVEQLRQQYESKRLKESRLFATNTSNGIPLTARNGELASQKAILQCSPMCAAAVTTNSSPSSARTNDDFTCKLCGSVIREAADQDEHVVASHLPSRYPNLANGLMNWQKVAGLYEECFPYANNSCRNTPWSSSSQPSSASEQPNTKPADVVAASTSASTAAPPAVSCEPTKTGWFEFIRDVSRLRNPDVQIPEFDEDLLFHPVSHVESDFDDPMQANGVETASCTSVDEMTCSECGIAFSSEESLAAIGCDVCPECEPSQEGIQDNNGFDPGIFFSFCKPKSDWQGREKTAESDSSVGIINSTGTTNREQGRMEVATNLHCKKNVPAGGQASAVSTPFYMKDDKRTWLNLLSNCFDASYNKNKNLEHPTLVYMPVGFLVFNSAGRNGREKHCVRSVYSFDQNFQLFACSPIDEILAELRKTREFIVIRPATDVPKDSVGGDVITIDLAIGLADLQDKAAGHFSASQFRNYWIWVVRLLNLLLRGQLPSDDIVGFPSSFFYGVEPRLPTADPRELLKRKVHFYHKPLAEIVLGSKPLESELEIVRHNGIHEYGESELEVIDAIFRETVKDFDKLLAAEEAMEQDLAEALDEKVNGHFRHLLVEEQQEDGAVGPKPIDTFASGEQKSIENGMKQATLENPEENDVMKSTDKQQLMEADKAVPSEEALHHVPIPRGTPPDALSVAVDGREEGLHSASSGDSLLADGSPAGSSEGNGRKRTASGKSASSKPKRVKRVKKQTDAKTVKKRKSKALKETDQYVPKWERRFKGHKCSEDCGVESDGKVDAEEVATYSSEHKRVVEKYFSRDETPACNERRMLMVYDYQGSLCCTSELQPDPSREALDTRAKELRLKYEKLNREKKAGIASVCASSSLPATVVRRSRSDSLEMDLEDGASASSPSEPSTAFVVHAQATNQSSPRKKRRVLLVPDISEEVAKKAMEMMRLKTMFVCNSKAPKARVLAQHVKQPPDSSSMRYHSRIQRETCIDLHPAIQRCRVCAGDAAQDIPEVCRFQGFRRLITCKFIGRPLRADFFATSAHDMSKLKQWLPDASNDSFVRGLTEKSACYALQNIRPMFEQILKGETLAKNIAKRMKCEGPFLKPLCGARELCDLCDGTIFNLHYFCQACCFTICLTCLLKRLKKFCADEAIEADNMYVDIFDWPLCRIGEEHFPHNPTKLSLGQMIPDDPADGVGTTLFKLAKCLDYVCEKFDIPNGHCACPDSLSGADGTDNDASMDAQETAEVAPTASASAASSSSDDVGTARLPSCYCAKMEVEGGALPCHEYACGGEKLLIIHDPKHENAFAFFQQQWRQSKPIIVSSIDKKLDSNLWRPQSFLGYCKDEMSRSDLVDCRTGTVYTNLSVRTFFNGFMNPSRRLKNKIWKLKDWPACGSFAERMKEHYKDFTQALPIPIYSLPDSGGLNLATRLPASMYLPPDLGPKMYNAFEMGFDNEQGTTNLHLDISDAVNLLVCVRCPKKGQNAEEDAAVRQKFFEEMTVRIKEICDDEVSLKRALEKPEEAGALWTIFKPEDTPVIRDYLRRRQRADAKQMRSPLGVDSESASATPVDSDVIHDQMCYVTKTMRDELQELNVRGFSFVQMLGDAVFIPAGATHQVHNLQCCIKVAEDFVSPEGVLSCSKVASEFRRLSRIHTNHEDILQLENIIYHAVKDSVSYLLRKSQNKDAIDIPFEVKAIVKQPTVDAKADRKSDAGAAPDADADSDDNFDPFAGREARRAAALDGNDFAPSFYGETPEQQIVPPLNQSSRVRGQHASLAYKHKVVQYAMTYGKTQARLHFRETTAHVSRWCKDVDNIRAKFAMEQSALAASFASSSAQPCTSRQSVGSASAIASEGQCSSSSLG